MEPILPIQMVNHRSYLQLLGIFHTSGMVFGRKARLLDDLITHSDDNRKQKLLEAFNKIRAAKRDIIAHSYHGSDELSVQYVERNTSGRFKANVHTYTFNEFKQYVQDVSD